MGKEHDRRLWRKQGVRVGVAVKISRANGEQEILVTARGGEAEDVGSKREAFYPLQKQWYTIIVFSITIFSSLL